MADKNKASKTQDTTLPSAPEMGLIDAEAALTAAQKRRLEEEFSVDRDDTPSDGGYSTTYNQDDPDATPVVKPAKQAKGDDMDEPKDQQDQSNVDDELEGAEEELAKLAKDELEDEPKDVKPKKRGFFAKYWQRKAWTLPLTILVIALGIAFGWPLPRYILLGTFIEKNYSVLLLDAKTNKPVSGAMLSIDGAQAKTDAQGKATIKAKVGPHDLMVDKKYYKSHSQPIFVGLKNRQDSQQVTIDATGRQVPLSVVNKVTGKALPEATVKVAGTEVKTDKDGKAIIVLPADKASLNGTLSAKGFNDQKVSIQVTENQVKENSFSITPTGKVYFLSRLSGTIDVVKTDLDGGNRQTVVTGTGKEENGNTVLLASRDWKYLTLLAKRDSSPAKLYLIDTETDKMSVMDEGDASFSLSGWSEHIFAYSVSRNGVKPWQPNVQAVKTYNAEKKQIATIDQTEAQGDSTNYTAQYFTNFYLLRDKLIYAVAWNTYRYYFSSENQLAGKNIIVREVAVGTTDKKDVKTFPADQSYFQRIIPYSPTEAYIDVYSNTDSKEHYYEYDDGKVENVSDSDAQRVVAQPSYPTYLLSPAGSKTAWSEARDGHSIFFIGDAAGKDGKQFVDLNDEYQVYGWYTNDYLLLSKKGSELYIVSAAGGTPLKITDYHKPELSYRGYGGGYGGL